MPAANYWEDEQAEKFSTLTFYSLFQSVIHMKKTAHFTARWIFSEAAAGFEILFQGFNVWENRSNTGTVQYNCF